MFPIEESDWRHLRDLQQVLLDRYCHQILLEVEEIVSKHGEAAHARHVAIYKLVRDRDRELADMFNDLRRSNAFLRILVLRRKGLFTDEEFAGFGDETKNRIIAAQAP